MTINIALKPSVKKLLSATDKDHYRKAELIKLQKPSDHVLSIPSRSIYNTAPAPKTQRTPPRREWKDYRSQGDRMSAMRPSPTSVRETTLIKSQ